MNLVHFSLLLLLCAEATAAPAPRVDFVRDVQPILENHCYECHGEKKQKSGLRLDIKAAALKGGDQFAPAIIAGRATDSPLIRLVTSQNKDDQMPPKGNRLSATSISILSRWINEGAHWPEGIDRVNPVDKRDHWSFKPVQRSVPPRNKRNTWARGPIDRFILAELEKSGLAPAQEADRVTWLRRLSYDLVGLPPSPESVESFINDQHPDAYERVVDAMLSSPRYGERWAQHWLDVVRYADTHGFEVNTERPNAWPYRDYVIRAFNLDTPYDQFIREQLIGDSLQQDAATGFLVTASVLLPGQIGADEPSKRLARQDSLDEIVINTSQTFLGLSVACARCHDHKFDPISQVDYYAMQSFFAGVEYEDRPMHTPEADSQRKKAELLKMDAVEIETELAKYEPLAQVAVSSSLPTNPKLNEIDGGHLETKFVRFTVWDANLHPTLGLIEPCIDELEVFSDESIPRNVALPIHGAKVTASGSRSSENHQLAFINDGRYGNSRSWMSDEAGRGWVVVELAEPVKLGKIRWSRDREGVLVDRLPTAYKIEVGLTLDSMKRLTFIPPPRPEINPRANTDRFKPVKTKRVRFSIKRTNDLEPCIDELEVFDTSGQNVALASSGTVATSSGDTVVADIHELRQVNDGEFGNSRSWMSNTRGEGWITLEFPSEHLVERVVWGRDREGVFMDRLATEYQIEVSNTVDQWQTVARSTDRRAFGSGDKNSKANRFLMDDLLPEDLPKVESLLARKKVNQSDLAATASGQVAFAGKFRTPDKIHLLARGDPEQPKDEVTPALLKVLGDQSVPNNHSELDRRRFLADWIASPANPLTARVMVNRIWQGHFGIGLVETPSDFGNNGSPASHPQLLDWLASEFIRSGWSIKHLHRLIVLSSTYRQSNRIRPVPQSSDADVRLLWRFPSRRIEAEVIRDSMLMVSGRLNESMYGRGFDLFDLRGGLSGFKPVESFQGDGLRRMIYSHKLRREREAVFGAFDCPDAGQSTARRRESTTPIQALNLFNSRFTFDEATALAARVKTEAGEAPSKQIQRVWQLTLNRAPSPNEIDEAEPVVRKEGLPTLCRALLNCNEFLLLP